MADHSALIRGRDQTKRQRTMRGKGPSAIHQPHIPLTPFADGHAREHGNSYSSWRELMLTYRLLRSITVTKFHNHLCSTSNGFWAVQVRITAGGLMCLALPLNGADWLCLRGGVPTIQCGRRSEPPSDRNLIVGLARRNLHYQRPSCSGDDNDMAAFSGVF